jgi:general secretion pathway protein G
MIIKIRSKGFTLLEIMIVVVIIGILASFIVPKLMHRPDQARVIKAKQDILTLENALELYKLDNGRYPTTQQSLEALVHKPTISPIPNNWSPDGYIKKLTKDPWGNPYHYRYPGKKGEFDIYSDGADGKEGGEGMDQEIGNWDINDETSTN